MTEYHQVIKVCACGHRNDLPLPFEGCVHIGPQMAALITYLNVEHSLPYGRLTQITADVLGFAISEGTVANKLKYMLTQAKGIIQRIKAHVIAAAWTGSDETGTQVVSLLSVGTERDKHNSQKLPNGPNMISQASSHSRRSLLPTGQIAWIW